MKFFTLTALTALLLVSTVQGQFSLSGRIVEKATGKVLPGAHIILEGTYLITTSDVNGEFNFKDLSQRNYTLKISFIGFQTHSEQIELKEDLRIEVEMERTAIMQDEVIIRASRLGNENPASGTLLDREDIQRQNDGKDLPMLLSLTPSLTSTSDAGTGIGYTALRLRGSDASRINVTLNGIPLNDAESQSVFWVDLPDLASSVENISIQRGVGTSSNGSSAFGGSINIKTREMKAEPYASYDGSAGSFRTFRNTLSFGTGLIKGHWSIDGRLSKITSDGYIDRAFSDLKSIFISAGYYGEKSILKFNLISGKEKTYQSWAGVPKDSLKTNRTYNPFTYENQTDNYQQDHYQTFFSRELHRNLLLNMALHYTCGRGYYEEYQDLNDPYSATSLSYYGLDTLFIGSDTISKTDLIRQKWLSNDFYGATASLHYKSGRWDIILGSSWNTYSGRAYGEIIWARFASDGFKGYRWYENNSNKSDYSVYLKAKFNANSHIGFFGDLQYRYIDYRIKGTEDAFGEVTQQHYFSFLNPRVGIELMAGEKHTSFLALAMANREPSRQNYIDATADDRLPVHETLYDLELGHEYRSNKIVLTGNLYYMQYRNQLVATGEIDNVGYPILRNVPSSYRAGIELVAGLKPVKGLQWDLNATLSRNRIKDFSESVDDYDTWGKIIIEHGETEISFSPSLIAGSMITWEPVKNLRARLSSKYVGSQYIDNTASKERSLDPYFINNFKISYHITKELFQEIGISFEILNLFNEEYETNAWVYRYYQGGQYYTSDGYFPQAGIHFMAGLWLKL
ncbi:MAG: TonB-dependent receptor [Bacteroidetes bacterium]|nr:TonB-dependent receptor [Bacteroidota bacterium]